MSYQPQQISYEQQQLRQIQTAAFLETTVSVLLAVALGAWVVSQLKKAFRGEEVERPF